MTRESHLQLNVDTSTIAIHTRESSHANLPTLLNKNNRLLHFLPNTRYTYIIIENINYIMFIIRRLHIYNIKVEN